MNLVFRVSNEPSGFSYFYEFVALILYFNGSIVKIKGVDPWNTCNVKTRTNKKDWRFLKCFTIQQKKIYEIKGFVLKYDKSHCNGAMIAINYNTNNDRVLKPNV